MNKWAAKILTCMKIPNSFRFCLCTVICSMFTGIIETLGTIEAITTQGTNKTFHIQSPISTELAVDQSVSHNGVCLTVEAINGNTHQVTAIAETLQKSNLDRLQVGAVVNLERCMTMHGRLDGHIVQGHVDTTATCTKVTEMDGSWQYDFTFTGNFGHLIIEKGSIAINGTSLTCFNVGKDRFSVAIIPYTYEHTNFHRLQAGDTVNLEFDILGKYVQRWMELR